MSRPVLLDVNILIALFEETHVHHQMAHDWFRENRHRGWATCPLTENGFVRIMSHPMAGRSTLQASVLAMHLRGLCSTSDHLFWPASLSLRDTSRFDLSAAPARHLTAIYLAGLAHANGGVFATFDRSIRMKPVIGAPPDLLEVIGP